MRTQRENKTMIKNSGKGKVYRPCHVCGITVNYVPWAEESAVRKSRIWHWANVDGSHHIHGEDIEQIKHLEDIWLGN